MTLKAKPAFNYQSVEFEMEISNNQDWEEFKRWYSRLYSFLQKVAPEEPKKGARKASYSDGPTEGQLKVAKRFGIEFPQGCTRKEAGEIIEESRKAAQAEKEDEDLPFSDDADDDTPF